MNKSMISYVVLAIAVILGCVLFFYSRNSKPPKVIGYNDFTCPAMSGYSFQYPVFDGLENISIPEENLCELRIKKTDSDWTIFVIKIDSKENDITNLNQTNPNGIFYAKNSDINEYTVKLNNSSNNKVIGIRIDALPIWQTINIKTMLEEYSKNIINSLKLNPNPFLGEEFSLKLGEVIQIGNLKITHTEILDQVKLEANGKIQIITLENDKPIKFQGYTVTKSPKLRSQLIIWLKVIQP